MSPVELKRYHGVEAGREGKRAQAQVNVETGAWFSADRSVSPLQREWDS